MRLKRTNNVNATLIDTLSEITGIDSFGITDDTLIFEELGLDSLMAIEILAKIEKQFDIIIEESLLIDINTVGDFIQVIEKKISIMHKSA
jgi:acyl carrier protein